MIDEKLSVLNLKNIRDTKVSLLSDGEKRVLTIALALLGTPKILILDEPTASLDLFSRKLVWETLLSLKGKLT